MLRTNTFRRRRGKGSKRIFAATASRGVDTSLSLKDGSDPLEVDCPPPISIDGDVTWTFKEITSDQGLRGQHKGYNQDG